jgi:hypothetical protein
MDRQAMGNSQAAIGPGISFVPALFVTDQI